MFPSLQEVIDYWNLPYAKGSLEEFWDNDIDTFDIPRNIIEPYLLNDLGVTKEIFIRQVKQAESRKILPLLLSEMAARRATIDMEFNGMRINVLGLEEEKKSLEGQLEFYKEVIESEMLAKFGTYSEPNASSDEDISKFLYGGVVELTIREEVGVFKTGPKKGQKKYKKFKEANVVQSVLKYETFNLISEKFKDTFHKKKNGIYAVGEDVLREILKHEDRGFIRNVLQYRKLKKDISTYYQGLEKHIWVHDHVIHPKFNHCATVTGRLSSSSPNFQNISGYKGE
jgi:DNA polymerase I-like protein with 3'-5' exonuclease and polymerase domains